MPPICDCANSTWWSVHGLPWLSVAVRSCLLGRAVSQQKQKMAKIMQKRLAGWAAARRAGERCAPTQCRSKIAQAGSGLSVRMNRAMQAMKRDGVRWARPDRTASRI
jgi:hypothetical protein